MKIEGADNFIITGDDLRQYFYDAAGGISYGRLSEESVCHVGSHSLKLISTLSHMGFVNSLMKIAGATLNFNKISRSAQLEVNLYFFAMLGATPAISGPDSNIVKIQSIIDGDFLSLAPQVIGQDIATYAITIKYLCMWGHKETVIDILKASDTEVVNATLTHLLSISSLHSQSLTRVPNGQLRERWLTYFHTLSSVLAKFSNVALQQFNRHYAHFLSMAGQHDAANKVVKPYRANDARLHCYVEMRKLLHQNKVTQAIARADRLIMLKDGTETTKMQSSPFDRDLAEAVLCETNALLRNAGVDAFIISGTLLGCIREGRILEHDKDFDLGVLGWEAQFDVAQALVKSQNFSCSLERLRGQNLFLLGVLHIPSGYAFDIFFFHDNGSTYKHGIQFDLGATIHYEFTKFDLTEVKFLGQDFLIPDNYELFLGENYGDDWRTPDANYFVKLEAPALVAKSGVNFAYSIRDEMLDMLGKRVSPEKGHIFVEKMKNFARREDQPRRAVLNAFLRKLAR